MSTNPREPKRQKIDPGATAPGAARSALDAAEASKVEVEGGGRRICVRVGGEHDQDVSVGLPMESDCLQPIYYVRKCYAEYYELVIRLLEVKKVKYVTISGTPGIGKSVFYAYFLERYSAKNKDTTIITASFLRSDSQSIRTNVVVWKGGQVIGDAADENSAMDALLVKTKKEVGKGGKLIYLYDGPPIFPPQTAQMVCFTSPNETWFRMMAKNPHKRTLFMPLWDLEELQTAAKALDLAMDTSDTLLNYEEGALSVLDKVEQRYRTFGGVARECLSTVESIIESRQKEMEIFMSYFENVDNLVNFFNRTEAEVVLHGVGHYIPNPEGPGLYTLVVASEFVKQFLTDRWKRLEASTRNKICRELQAISAAASFRGVLFNVHEKTEQQDHSAGP